MSARFPSRWLFAAVLLVATGLTAAAQSLPSPGVPETTPTPGVGPLTRLLVEPLLLEREQVSEHSDRLPAMPMPRPTQGRGQPERLPTSDEVLLRCLLFSIHPLAAFLPIQIGTTELPPPQYLSPSPVMPCAAERLTAMPAEVEPIGVMPASEESELKFELLGPWTESALLKMLRVPQIEIEIELGPESSRCGTVACGTTPAPAPLPKAPDCKGSGVCPTDCTQVRLDVLIAEVTAGAARKLNLYHVTDSGAPRWVIEVAGDGQGKALQAGLASQREKGRVKVLSAPTLMTLSGQQGCVLTGGEQAVSLPDGNGQATVQFVPFGTQLTCRPTVLPDGTVRLEAEPEISEVCETAGITVQGTVVPGRSSQRVRTTADVAPGHALVMSGPKAGGNTRLVLLVTPTVIKATTEAVHELLEKCQRELSHGHFAAAAELAQEALLRDRKQVMADPLVCQSNLLQRVKAAAVLPLGTVSPCESKKEGRTNVAHGEGKAIGSEERMTEALMQEYNAAFREGRYHEAAALAERALQIDPDNAVAAGALAIASTQARLRSETDANGPAIPPQWLAAQAMARFRECFKQGRYEEARAEALSAWQAMPDDRNALAALKMACTALAQQPRSAEPPQCTYTGNYPRPADPAVVSALQKLLFDTDKRGPAGGVEEAEPKAQGDKPPRR